MSWYDNWLSKSNTKVPASTTFSGLDQKTTEDVNDPEFGIDAQMSGGSDVSSPFSLSGSMDWLGNNSKALGTGIQLGSMALDGYSTFFGQGKEKHDKNMTLLNQQIADNQNKLNSRKNLNAAWGATEAKKAGTA